MHGHAGFAITRLLTAAVVRATQRGSSDNNTVYSYSSGPLLLLSSTVSTSWMTNELLLGGVVCVKVLSEDSLFAYSCVRILRGWI